MSDQVDLAMSLGIPEVNSKDEECTIDILKVNLLARVTVQNDQLDARRWSNGPAILWVTHVNILLL